MVTTKLNLSMTEPQVRQIYAKQGDTGRVLDITLDQTPEDGTLRILRPDGTEVTSEAVTGGEVSESGETVTFESMTEADVTELTVGIEPVQDLNGYDSPWVGGAGVNIIGDLELRSTTTTGNVTATLQSDGSSYALSGTPSAPTDVYLQASSTANLETGSYYLYAPTGTGIYGATGDYLYIAVKNGTNPAVYYGVGGNTSATAFTLTEGDYIALVFVRVASGVNTNGKIVTPMIVKGTTAPTSYAPYSNICPITGHDEVTVTDEGTNLLNYDAWKTVSITRGTAVWENNGVTLTATSTDCFTDWSNAAFPQGARVSVTEGETITLAWDATPTWLGNAYIFPNGQTSGLVTAHSDAGHLSYTVASGVTYLTFRFGVSSSGVTESYKNIQIVRGTTVPTWTPYVAPHTYTTSLGQTVYGGTLDMVTGQLVVDRVCKTLTTARNLSGTYSGSIIYNSSSAETTDADFAKPIQTNNLAYVGNSVTNFKFGTCINANGTSFNLWIKDGAFASLAEASEWLVANETQLCYYLASPVTYQLTAQQIKTLVGTNNVWASSGDIISIKFAYGGLLSELPSEATEIIGKCYCDVEQNGVSSMPFTLNVKKNERQ